MQILLPTIKWLKINKTMLLDPADLKETLYIPVHKIEQISVEELIENKVFGTTIQVNGKRIMIGKSNSYAFSKFIADCISMAIACNENKIIDIEEIWWEYD